MKWGISYYRDRHHQPVREYLDALQPGPKARILRNLQLLAEFGPDLGWPYISKVRGKLWELRTTYGGKQYRMLFALIPASRIIVLHGFQKKTQKLPDREIALAEKRLLAFLQDEQGGS